MPIFLLGLLGGLASIAGNIVGRVLVALAIGYVTYQGVDILMGGIKSAILSNLNIGYPEIQAALSMLNIGKAINVTFSAIAARNILNGLSGGKITKQVIK
jgi:hypothetical protein